MQTSKKKQAKEIKSTVKETAKKINKEIIQ